MGARIDSRCKLCIKTIRANEYRRLKSLPADHARGKITKVIMKEVVTMSADQFKREMESVELILENLIYKVLSKKISRGEK